MNKVKSNDIEFESDEYLIMKNTSHEWIISYSDLVTLLLCFFILFFSIAARKKIQNVKLETATITKEKIEARFEEKQKDAVNLLKINNSFNKISHIFSQIEVIDGVNTEKEDNHFLIKFKETNFFDYESNLLNLNGKYITSLVLQKLIPHSNNINVEIKAFSHEMPEKKSKYKSNIHLSFARAMNVYGYFTKLGFPQNSISISGISTNKIEERESGGLIFKVESR